MTSRAYTPCKREPLPLCPCTCEPKVDGDYLRKCPVCAEEHESHHCAHDGVQHRCPWCDARPEPVAEKLS